MPRAFCPECGSEVPVDPDGICHVGHVIDLESANVRGDDLDGVDPGPESDEPRPWVSSVDRTTLGGYTPPPGAEGAAPTPAPAPPQPSEEPALEPPPPSSPASTPPVASVAPDGPAYSPTDDGLDATPDAFDIGGADDLAAAAAAAASAIADEASSDDDPGPWVQPVDDDGSDGVAPGWTAPSTSPVAGAPIPPPAPVDPPAPVGETLSGEFDLQDLEAAVTEPSTEDEPVLPPPPASPPATAASAPPPSDDDLDVLSAFDELDADEPAPAAAPAPPTATPTDLPPPAAPTAPAASEDATTSATPEVSEPDDIDLSNFTAKGASGSGRRGLFRKR